MDLSTVVSSLQAVVLVACQAGAGYFCGKKEVGAQMGLVSHILQLVVFPSLNPPPPFNKISILSPPPCGAVEATGLGFVCCVVFNPCVFPKYLANRVDVGFSDFPDLGFILFLNFPISHSPPPPTPQVFSAQLITDLNRVIFYILLPSLIFTKTMVLQADEMLDGLWVLPLFCLLWIAIGGGGVFGLQ